MTIKFFEKIHTHSDEKFYTKFHATIKNIKEIHMKIAFGVLLMVLSLLTGFQQAITVVHFKLNQQVIEQKFCINKNKPALQCHGSCHLKKQLEETESSEAPSISIYPRIDMFTVSATQWEIKNATASIRNKTFIYKERFYTAPYIEVLVPPPIA